MVQIKSGGLPPGIDLITSGSDGSDMSEWQLDIRVLDQNPLYTGETYRLKFRFSKHYPIGSRILVLNPGHVRLDRLNGTHLLTFRLVFAEAPEVVFEKLPGRPVPIHPHIYSNGIICLDLLGSSGWSPVQSVQSVCMSIQSMLTSNNNNERPPGDEDFVRGNRQRPRDIEFVYHDHTV
jgi:ubiquitin-conjugating enzyme E2 W